MDNFDRRAWAKGLVLDLRGRHWLPQGVTLGKDDKISIRVKLGKPKKVVKPIKAAVRALTFADDDKRTIESHRDRVEMMAERYNRGCDPITGVDLAGVKSFECYTEHKDRHGNIFLEEKSKPVTVDEKAVALKTNNGYTAPAVRTTRYQTKENDGLKLLADAFRRIGETLPEDDDF
jgi:hypothetical protein